MASQNIIYTPGTPQTFKSAVKGGKNDLQSSKDKPKGPDKPLMPYMRFTKHVWDQVRDQYPHMKVWEISKVIGSMWKGLSEKEKQVYIDSFETDKIKYDEAFKVYQNSPAYQAWLASTKVAAINKENETLNDTLKPQTPQPPQLLTAKKDKKKPEGRVGIQIPEFDFPEDDDYFSVKHLATARYFRNHKLMYEVLNETNLADVRQTNNNNNKERLMMLRNHVESLSAHTKKIEAEIERDVACFEARKRELLESSDRFNEEYNQLVKKMALGVDGGNKTASGDANKSAPIETAHNVNGTC